MPQAKRYSLTSVSSDIGAVLARELASRGHELALAARREANLQQPAAELLESGARLPLSRPTPMIAQP